MQRTQRGSSHWLLGGMLLLGITGALSACRADNPPATVVEPVAYLSSLEKDVLQEMNLARTQPKAYAAFVEKLRPNYVRGQQQAGGGHTTSVTAGGRTTIVTAEGPKALDEAVAFLRTTAPLPALTVSRGMSRAAREHALEQAQIGTMSHQGRNGSQPWDRADRHGRWRDTFSENLVAGHASARDMTMALIIDDGLPERGHRKNIFNGQARMLGVGCGPDKAKPLCVTTFAGSYDEGAQ